MTMETHVWEPSTRLGTEWAEYFKRSVSMAGTFNLPVVGWQVRPAGVVGTVHDIAFHEVSVDLLPMPAEERARWLGALGFPAFHACPLPNSRRVRALQARGLGPVPGWDGLVAQCHCRQAELSGRCVHAQAVLAILASLIAADPMRLWRWRGLNRPIGPVADPYASLIRFRPKTVLAKRARVRFSSRWRARSEGIASLPELTLADWQGSGGDGALSQTPPAPWDTEPKALGHLGPLPHARGQADTVTDLMQIWTEMRAIGGQILSPPGPHRRRKGATGSSRPRS